MDNTAFDRSQENSEVTIGSGEDTSLILPQSLKALFPFQSRFLEIEGFRMHYIDEGLRSPDAPVVLLLHGNPTWSFYYRNVIQVLSSEFRVLALDYIGCGLSDHPRDVQFRASDRIRHVKTFLDKLSIGKFSLVMHDWGGPIGTGVALDKLAQVERLVYLNTTLTEIESLPRIIRQSARPLIGKFITMYTQRFLRLATEWGVVKKLPPEVKAGYLFPYASSQRRTAIWGFVADIPFDSNHPTYTDLVHIAEHLKDLQHIPVKIIWGLKDPCFHREMLGRVAAHFPQAEVVEVPDASHLILEDGGSQVNESIRSFLKGEESNTLEAVQGSTQGALFEAFQEVVRKNPNLDALIRCESFAGRMRYSHTSYRELSVLVNKFQRGLSSLGLTPGMKVLFLVPVGVEFLALALAVMGRGGIPVFVDPGVGKEKLKKCITDAEPDAVIAIFKAQILRFLWRRAFRNCKFFLTASDWFPFGEKSVSFLRKYSDKPLHPVPSPGTTFIAFTSGATGTPKGVLYTDSMLRSQLRILHQDLGMIPGGKDMPLLPIFSLFNVGLGVTTVLPNMNPAKPLSLNPAQIVKTVRDLGVVTSFGSPTLWNKISEYLVRSGGKVSSLKKVFIAGAPVSQTVLEQVSSILEDGEVIIPYGATEALPVSVVRGNERMTRQEAPSSRTGEKGVYVGHPLPDTKLEVIEPAPGVIAHFANAKELPPYEIGEIIVSGDHVSPSYLNRPDANHLGKIYDGDIIWHRIGDMGYRDDQGALYFCGRKAHIVQVGEDIFYSIPVESVFNRSSKVRRSALIALIDTNEAAVVVEPLPQYFPYTAEERAQFIAELQKLALEDPVTEKISKFFFHPSFPVDARHNAKIYRDQLGKWASEEARSA